MQILLTEDNFLRGYSLMGTTVGAIDVEDIPQEVQDNHKAYKYIGGKFVLDNSKVQEQQQVEALQTELQEIHQWFEDTDYIVLKVFRGNWLETDARYVEYKAEYIVKKNRMDEITAILEEE